MYVCVCVYMYECVCIYICVCVCVCVSMRVGKWEGILSQQSTGAGNYSGLFCIDHDLLECLIAFTIMPRSPVGLLLIVKN